MIEFRTPALIAPDASIIGVIEEGGAHLAFDGAQSLKPGDALPQEPGNYVLDHALARTDAVSKARAVTRMLALCRAGATFVIASHDEALLESCADEIWWLRQGELIGRGHPADVLPLYRRHVAQALRSEGKGGIAAPGPALRAGDGRAELESIELTGEDGAPATVWRSGEQVAVRVTFRYLGEAQNPVIGMLIRTRIGLNVYGTNTELERISFGPVRSGDTARVTYRFRCDLCPGDYTITAASHDPDGAWHDWQEDAVAFAVSDERYTAGVANLRAQASVEVLR